MGVLCIDFVKAFDSVEHEFIENALKFFKFGDNMVRMVMTLLKNRDARVMIEEGLTGSFRIQRETPQGDRASPYIFIICIEVLLIKIKCKCGNGIDNCNFINEWVSQNGLEKEGTAEGFADDLTLMFKFTQAAMEMIVEVMAEFRLCSGLELNKTKTQLMIVGSNRIRVGDVISEIAVVERVKNSWPNHRPKFDCIEGKLG